MINLDVVSFVACGVFFELFTYDVFLNCFKSCNFCVCSVFMLVLFCYLCKIKYVLLFVFLLECLWLIDVCMCCNEWLMCWFVMCVSDSRFWCVLLCVMVDLLCVYILLFFCDNLVVFWVWCVCCVSCWM